MFGIGMPEMIMIFIVALIVIGPKKLPDIAKGLGRAFSEFKKATNDVKESMGIDNEMREVKHTFDEINKDIQDTIDAKPTSTDKPLTNSQRNHQKKETKTNDTDTPSNAD